MKRVKEFLIEKNRKFAEAVDNGMEIRISEDEIFYWMGRYAKEVCKEWDKRIDKQEIYLKMCKGNFHLLSEEYKGKDGDEFVVDIANKMHTKLDNREQYLRLNNEKIES